MRPFNILLATDNYKLGHMVQYKTGVNKVYSYLTARSNKVFDKTVFFGLQYYLKEYFTRPILKEHGDELITYYTKMLGEPSDDVKAKIRALCDLGYLPIKIKAVPEGTVMGTRNVLLTITNTDPEFYWVVGFVESILLKIWYPITVASCVHKYRTVVDEWFEKTVDPDMYPLKDFMVHDFGYRGDTSEEGAAISGGAHLLSFLGSDTITGFPFLVNYYQADINEPVMYSVPASEHSVMCSFGREDELEAFNHMLDLYPSGIVSIVSDTFNIYQVLTDFAERLKTKILERDGKVVFRPDSGNPEYIICGDPNAEPSSPEWKGAIRLLDEKFGSTINSKGYKVLNPKVGLIYGDGMYLERYQRTLQKLAEMGYAASNLVIGVGGILRNHSRDTMGFAIKATYVEINGTPQEIEKDPITDPGKKSLKGLLHLGYQDGDWITSDCVSPEMEDTGHLETVFYNGNILKEYCLKDIRSRVSGV